MQLVWTVGAVQSLRQIRHYIQEENPSASAQVAKRIEHAVLRLKTFPQLGRPGLRGGTRELVVAGLPYVAVYRVAASEVQILRVFHTKQRRH